MDSSTSNSEDMNTNGHNDINEVEGEEVSDRMRGPASASSPNGGVFDIVNRSEDSTYYNLKKMGNIHHEIVRRIVAGQRDHEIAKALGVTSVMVKYTRHSPVVKAKLDILMGARDESSVEIRKRIASLAPLALQQLEEIMIDESESGNVRTKIAQDLLDRAGYNPIKKTWDVSKVGNEKIAEIKQRARQNGLVADEDEPVDDLDLEEGEYEEES